MIINPIAVPHPGQSEGNYSWMYLMTPYYNQLVKEFNTQQIENDILKQHYEYYLEMEKEKELLSIQYEQLRKAERQLIDQVENAENEALTLQDKVEYMDRNLQVVHPEKFREMNEKVENLQNIIKSKDNVVDQLLNEISLIKNEKDDLQNEVLFKKQKIENLNFEYNTKEHEYQRLWEEEQVLKAEIRGETSNCKDIYRENEAILREIAMVRDEISQNQAIYEQRQLAIQEQRMRVSDYEERLRYGNDIIMQLESESQQIQVDLAQQKAVIEGQNKAYNELKQNFYLLNNRGSGDGQMQLSTQNPIVSVPKIMMPSNYYKPSVAVQRSTINLMPSTSKSLTQQVTPQSIKSYLSIKKTVIDLTADIGTNKIAIRDQKVRFSVQDNLSTGGLQQSPNQQILSPQRGYKNMGRRSDSMNERLDRRTFNNLLDEDQNSRIIQSPEQPNFRRGNFTREQMGEIRVQSVNRNFVDTMSGLLGMNEDTQKVVNMRASVQGGNSFPLKKVDLRNVSEIIGSPQKNNNFKDSSQIFNSPGYNNHSQYRGETEATTTYDNRNWREDNQNGSMMIDQSISQNYDNFRMSTMSTQTPYRNKFGAKGGPGNRNIQPQQLSSVKQRQHPQTTRNPKISNEPQYRQATWQERMSQLPKMSAYKSSITFGEDGVTANPDQQQDRQVRFSRDQHPSQTQYQPFQMTKDYDVDVQAMNEDDPQAKAQIVKFKQQKIYDLADQRKMLQSQASHIPEFSKQMAQRQKRQELDSEIQKITKRISILKYDLKKLTCKDDE